MNRLVTSLVLASLLSGCGPQDTAPRSSQSEAPDSTPQLDSGIVLKNMDTSVDPGDDFNAYVNGGWMATAEIPPDRAAATVGLEVHERATENVREIIRDSAEGDFAPGSAQQKVGDLYTAFMDLETRNELGVDPLKSEFAAIESLPDRDALAAYFAEASRHGINVPFNLDQYVDFKDPDTYMMFTWQGGLGLPDREYYFEEGEKAAAIRAAYREHIVKMFELAGLPDARASADTIVALEKRMAGEHMLKEKPGTWWRCTTAWRWTNCLNSCPALPGPIT